MVFSSALPTGARSSYMRGAATSTKVNRWEWAQPECAAEIERLKHNDLDPDLSPAEHKDLLGRLYLLLRKGAFAELHVAKPGAEAVEAQIMRKSAYVIELKPHPQDRPAFGNPPRHLRLYYAEPLAVSDLLLGLRLATKSDGLPGLAEQDADVLEAERRADAWVP